MFPFLTSESSAGPPQETATTAEPLRIGLVVAPLSSQGGTWTHLQRWAAALDPSHFHLTLFYHSPEPLTSLEAARHGERPLTVVPLPALQFWGEGPLPVRFMQAVQALRNALRSHHIALVHTLFVGSDLVGMAAGRSLGLPVITSVEGALLVSHLPRGRKAALQAAWTVGSSGLAALTAVSDATAAELDPLLGPGAPRPQVLRPGVPPAPLRPLPPAGPALVTIGRLAPVKGLPVLIEAIEPLTRALPTLTLTLVGDGPDRSPLEALIRSRRLEARVRITGWLPPEGVQAVLEQSHLLIQPSHHEGLPWTVLEAAARGVPAIASRVGGLGEAIIPAPAPQHTGWLVPAGRSDLLRDALRQAIGTPDAVANLEAVGQRAQRFVQAQFSQTAEGEALGALYRDVNRRRRRSASS